MKTDFDYKLSVSNPYRLVKSQVTGKYTDSYNKSTRVLGDTKAAFDK